MNREELEKMFDEKINEDWYYIDWITRIELKQFIFETIMSEVLKDLTFSNETCLCCQNNKQKLKEFNNNK
jgi:hypothetical protein